MAAFVPGNLHVVASATHANCANRVPWKKERMKHRVQVLTLLVSASCRSIFFPGSTVSSVNGAECRSVDTAGGTAGSATAPDTAGMAGLRVFGGHRTHGGAAALLLLASIGPDMRTAARGLLDMRAPGGQCREVVDMRALQFELSDRPAGSITRVCLGPSECAPSPCSSHLRASQCHL